jgi:endonuclease G
MSSWRTSVRYRQLFWLSLLLAFVVPRNVVAACPDVYLDRTPPRPAAGLVELCSEGFSDLWDPAARTARYASEVLYADRLRAPGRPDRERLFHEEARLPVVNRVSPDALAGSGYDRGHLAPAGDMATPESMLHSFSMANVVPQNPSNNRGAWARVEEATRSLVVSVFRGRGYVVTGPIFWGDTARVGTMLVPQKLFKALYVQGDAFGNPDVVGAWVVENADDPKTTFVPLAYLRDMYGIDAFPSLPEGVKSVAKLPASVAVRTGAAMR